jgi:long-chain acyl-CoA synthetase
MNSRPWLESYPPGVPHDLADRDLTISRVWLDTVAAHPDYLAASLNNQSFTYQELNLKANGLAHGLRSLGVGPGDRVALILPNSPTYIIAYFGLLKIGAVAANINVMAHGEELVRILDNCGAKIAITLDIFAAGLYAVLDRTPVTQVLLHSVFGQEKNLPDSGPRPLIFNDLVAGQPHSEPDEIFRPDDPAVLQYTSGTTGRPKAAILTHRNLTSNVRQAHAWIKHRTDPGNRAVICIIPFFHVFGLTACLNLSVREGFHMILVPMFNVFDALPLLKLIEQYRPISLPAVPTLWATLVSSPQARGDLLKDIYVPSSGGAPLPDWVQEKFTAMTGRPILEAYGLSEATAATHFAPHPDGAPAGSIGLPLPGTEVRIVDLETGTRDLALGEIGEMIIRGPQIMPGYWADPELTAETLRQGWLHTGDLALMDQSGFFFLKDRKDDLIISSGFNVYPSEVEAALRRHPGVKNAAVVGTPARIRGESVTAFVALHQPGTLTREELLEHCHNLLADYKTPRTFIFVDDIPAGPTGKPLRKQLRETIADKNRT